jgi:eukaryotic-like serine/threonine-protein kinase
VVRGAFEFGLGHWLSAVDFCDQANAMFREQCTGVWWHQYMAASLSLWGLLNRGRLIELFQRIALWSAEAAARGIPYLETILKMRLGSMKRLAADDPEGARRQAEEALMGWSSTDFYLQHVQERLVQCNVDLYRTISW